MAGRGCAIAVTNLAQLFIAISQLVMWHQGRLGAGLPQRSLIWLGIGRKKTSVLPEGRGAPQFAPALSAWSLAMSAWSPKAAKQPTSRQVRFGPEADLAKNEVPRQSYDPKRT
jgi:hypothetical protein